MDDFHRTPVASCLDAETRMAQLEGLTTYLAECCGDLLRHCQPLVIQTAYGTSVNPNAHQVPIRIVTEVQERLKAVASLVNELYAHQAAQEAIYGPFLPEPLPDVAGERVARRFASLEVA